MIHLLLVFMLLFAASNDCAAQGGAARDGVYSLLRELQDAGLARELPQEMESFARAVAVAEERSARGETAESERLYLLARMKGELLAGRLRVQDAEDGALQRSEAERAPVPPAAAEAREEFAEEVEESVFDSEWGFPPVRAAEERLSARIIGGEGLYTVRRNDTLRLIASRLGVNLRDIASLNRIGINAPLKAGQKLRYNDRRIVPKLLRNGILVNIPERSLYLFKGGRLTARYPVAVGMAGAKDPRFSWKTPVGRFRVTGKIENPSWTVPPSIRREMEEKGEEVVRVVPPGPRNPLGKQAIKTTLSGIMIHGTQKPTSINTYSSHGCIRVMPEHMEDLFRSVTVSTPGEIIYQPVKVAVTGDKRVFLEVNRDVYGKVDDIREEVKRTLSSHRVAENVSWNRVRQVIQDSRGIAEEVTLQ